MSKQVIILGDPHIGKSLSMGKFGLGAHFNSRIVDQIDLLDWTLDQAIDKMIDDIIITGDVFEEPKPHSALVTAFVSWLKKCHAHHVNVHIIMGNHDMIRSGINFTSPLDIISEMELEGINVYKDIGTIFIGSAAFTLIPFRDRKSFNTDKNSAALDLLKNIVAYELSSIPITYKKIVVGHLAIEGSIPVGDEIDDIANELFCPIQMFRGYDYVWMGHVHKPQILYNHPHIAHIGSMDLSNFAEFEHKKRIIIVSCESNEGFIEEYIPCRPLRKIPIVVPKDIEDTTNYVIEIIKKDFANLNKAIVKVEVSFAAPELKSINKVAIENYLLSLGVFNIVSISESRKAPSIKKDANNTIDTKMDVVSAIKTYSQTYIEENLRPAFINLALELYSSYKMESKE